MGEKIFQSKSPLDRINIRRLIIHIKNLVNDFLECVDWNTVTSNEDLVSSIKQLLVNYKQSLVHRNLEISLEIELQSDGSIEIKIEDEVCMKITTTVEVETD